MLRQQHESQTISIGEELRRLAEPADTYRGSRATTVALCYVVVVLAAACIGAVILFSQARDRLLTTYLPQYSELQYESSPDDVAPAGAESTVSGAAGAGQAVKAVSTVANSPINVLVLGTDARAGDKAAPLTDTMILLTLDLQSQTAGILSLPRDLWLPIPHQNLTTKVNMAYRLGESSNYQGGGPQLAKDTVSSFIGQPVQYYVRVSFNGFIQIVDLIDGVDVVVPETIHDEDYPTASYGTQLFHLDAGTHHLDGATALKYVRSRNSDSDYGRARRQQQVVRALANKVVRADMIPKLLTKAPRLLYTMRSSIETDMPMALQFELANFFRDASINEIRQLVLDSRYGEETYSEEGAWILLPDRQRVRAVLDSFFSPSVQNSTTGGAAQNPEWVRIEILNGTGQPGIAAATRDVLRQQGWQVVSIGDADRSDYGETLIINYGIPDELIDRLSNDLALKPQLSTLNGLNSAAPVDMRIVVGRDILALVNR